MIVWRAAFAAASLLALTGLACAPQAGPPEAAGVWSSARVVEELVIGVEAGPEEYMLGAVQSVAVAVDGSIYVADRRPVAVRMYDSEGEFVRDIGRQGEGPGEYPFAPMLGFLPDGKPVVRSQSRVSLFSAGGEYLGGFPVVGFTGLLIDRAGDIHVHQAEGDVVLVRYSAAGEELGRLAFPPRDIAGDRTFVLAFGEGGIYPFPTETHSAWSPLGYLVTGRNDAYDVELRKPDGAVHLSRDVPASRVGSEEQAEWEAFRQTLILRDRARGGDNEYESIPETKPFFRRIHVGDDGRVWVFRYVDAAKRDDIEPLPDRPERPLLTWREPWTFDVFEPDGTFLGSVVAPERFRPFVFRGDRMWGAIVDDEGVERVVRLRVVPEGR